ncbi:unnamed protein product [Lactuca saligna]|uniref:Uncharacterized protein n=1 Tax=Lactuca saligna TaxID=75948 RepID=A0AA35ZT16_LACSI|nr:unnamed protein product [Lactuca saligna]
MLSVSHFVSHGVPGKILDVKVVLSEHKIDVQEETQTFQDKIDKEPNWWLGTADDGKAYDNRWWSKGLSQFKKIKEWSVLVAVPKLKTFIRRFNKQRRPHAKFQYDRASYLLNFDEGLEHLEDDDWLNHNFSTRYSVVSVVSGPSFLSVQNSWTKVT